MPKPKEPRAAQAIREEAAAHFAYMEERPWVFRLTPDGARRQAHLGNQLVDAALALADGEVLSLSAWFEEQACTNNDKTLVMGTLPYITGDALQLLEMQFTHAVVGVIPNSEVRALLDSDEARLYEGASLTKGNVYVQYRRCTL
jgi:hypothetical protein